MDRLIKVDEFGKEVEFIINQDSILHHIIKEANDENYVPRFSLKEIELFNDIPVNQPIKYSDPIIIKAIKHGLIFLINYKGAKDKNFAGHERVIYAMVLGRSSKGKNLLRGYHLSGWSVSRNTTVDKVWRMFRADRILSMTFTGSFFRLAPTGYNMNDKGMRGGIIAKADFNEIRRNQEKLIKDHQIQKRDDVSLEQGQEGEEGVEEKKIFTIVIENTDTQVNIEKFMENDIVAQVEDLDNLRVSFLQSAYGQEYICVLGAIGRPGNLIKVRDKEGNKLLGNFKVLDSAIGRDLKNVKNVKGNNVFDLYTFVEKRD